MRNSFGHATPHHDVPTATSVFRVICLLTVSAIWAASSSIQIADAADAHAVMPKAVESQNPEGATETDHLTLQSAELLALRIHGYANLSGEYRVNSDDTVSIPVFGRISVKNKTANQLEKELGQRITSITGTAGYATVEVARYRPILMTGAIAKAGTYTWSPGMRIIHGVALSGGSLVGGRRDEVPAVAARAQSARSVTDLKHALAALARLRSERGGATKIEMPKEFRWLVSAADAEEVMRVQQGILDKSLTAYKAQTSALESAIQVAVQEQAALENRAVMQERQLTERRSRNEDLERLHAKGYLARGRLLEDADRVHELEQRRDGAAVAIARVKSSVANFRQELIKLRQLREVEIEKEIMAHEREVQKHEIEVQASRSALILVGNKIEETDPGKVEEKLEYVVVRQRGDDVVRVQGEQMMALRPGDIVIVGLAKAPS